MRERVGENRFRLWLLINANRGVVTGALALGLFAFLVVVAGINTLPLRMAMRNGTMVERTFQAFVGALITGVTLVVTLNQLIISQELGSLSDQRDRMSGAMAFRRDVEGLLDSISPPEPASFMQAFVELSQKRAEDLRDATDDNTDSEVRERVGDFADGIHEHADSVADQLSDAQFGQFEVIQAILNYNYSWKVYEARRIRHDHEDALSEDERTAFDELIEVLEFFGPAREHFKTLYFQWELVDLSRGILYIAVPALAVSIASLLFLDPSAVPGTTLGVANIVLVISAAVAIASTPFFLLATYIVRLGTIAKRTLAIGPFILRESQRSEDTDFET